MKVVHLHSQAPEPSFSRPSSLTIGNFDGCHRGHQELLRSARELAQRYNAETMVLTFDPHPREFFSPEVSLPRLFQPHQKIRALAEQGVAIVALQRFDFAFSQLTPREFCTKLLAETLRARALTIGYDFRFGKGREGKMEHLQRYLPQCEMKEVGEIIINGLPVSSSAIRNQLQQSCIAVANQLLGRSYLLEGTIQKGRQLGRQLGFSTANIEVKQQMLPAPGVYCGWAVLEKEPPIFASPPHRIPCIINIGYRPTIEQSEPQLLVETHLLQGDYGPDSLYGLPIGIYLSDHIREEAKFSSLGALKEQIRLDCETAKIKLGGS